MTVRRVLAIVACLSLVPIMFGCQPPAPHLLSASVVPYGGGTVSPSGGPFTDKVTVVATPAQFYTFVGWAGDASGTVNPLTLKMNSDKSVSVTFVRLVKKNLAPIQKVGNTYGNAIISIDLNQSEWVEGTIDCDAALPAQAVYIQGPSGQRLKDLGRPGHATFLFQAAVAGKHDIVVQANYISSWGTTYSVAYTIYGRQ